MREDRERRRLEILVAVGQAETCLSRGEGCLVTTLEEARDGAFGHRAAVQRVTGFLAAPEAEAELDELWLFLARESGSADLATRVVESITERFWNSRFKRRLKKYPMGFSRTRDC